MTLSQKEFDLLTCLIRNRGMALSRDVLLERVWGYDFLGDSRTVDVHIRWLREKIEDDPSDPRYIRTVRGVGFVFDCALAPSQVVIAEITPDGVNREQARFALMLAREAMAPTNTAATASPTRTTRTLGARIMGQPGRKPPRVARDRSMLSDTLATTVVSQARRLSISAASIPPAPARATRQMRRV